MKRGSTSATPRGRKSGRSQRTNRQRLGSLLNANSAFYGRPGPMSETMHFDQRPITLTIRSNVTANPAT